MTQRRRLLPWCNGNEPISPGGIPILSRGEVVLSGTVDEDSDPFSRDADRALAIAARNALPALLEELEFMWTAMQRQLAYCSKCSAVGKVKGKPCPACGEVRARMGLEAP